MAKPVKSDVITTSRLPVICPACASKAIGVAQQAADTWRVSCERCEWTAKYSLAPKAA